MCPCCDQKTVVLSHPLPLVLIIFLPLVLEVPFLERYDMYVPSTTGHSIVSYSLRVDQVRVSANGHILFKVFKIRPVTCSVLWAS